MEHAPTAPTGLQVQLNLPNQVRLGWTPSTDLETTNSAGLNYNLRVGTILDCVALPTAMRAVAALTDRQMASRGLDLVLTNQSHRSWGKAFRVAGFLSGPSNYLLGMSPALASTINSERDGLKYIHVTRGDGDGRTNLR